ncbi:MAG TPA: hypothetical protein VEZ14_04950 [Dehalococcoidia bacterium]|nr:hypothetical protein [Dehalococcoidia bacterium]
MKKKIVLLVGIAAAAWGVKKLVSSDRESSNEFEQPQQPEERLAA